MRASSSDWYEIEVPTALAVSHWSIQDTEKEASQPYPSKYRPGTLVRHGFCPRQAIPDISLLWSKNTIGIFLCIGVNRLFEKTRNAVMGVSRKSEIESIKSMHATWMYCEFCLQA